MHPNPKEKAKELIDKFRPCIGCWAGDPSQTESVEGGRAKECAIIAVDEIINFLNRCPSFNKGKETDEIWSYWQQVKEELTKQK